MFDINNCLTAVLTTNVLEQQICNAGATEASTNYMDLGKANLQIANGKKTPILKFRVTEAFAGTGTTLTIDLESDTDSGFATALKQVIRLGVIPKARLVAGALLQFPLPPEKYQRYLHGYFTGDNTFETTGKAIMWIEDGADGDVAQFDKI